MDTVSLARTRREILVLQKSASIFYLSAIPVLHLPARKRNIVFLQKNGSIFILSDAPPAVPKKN